MLKNAIIRQLCENASLSIAELASATGASVPTVTKYLNSLEAKGWVVSAGKGPSSHGRQPRRWNICSESAYFLGVDPKHNALLLSLMDLSGNIVCESEERLNFENTPEMMETICRRCERFLSESGIIKDKLYCAAFNISGRVDFNNGHSYSIFNFENNDESLSRTLSERLGFKVLIDNDTRLMAYGELKRGALKDFSNCLFINVGWGIGLSIIIDGEVYYGMNGFSGEFGHTYVYDNEIMCHCGKKGCLETEVSGRAICAQTVKRIAGGETSVLHSETVTDEKEVIRAALRDDMLSIEVIEHAGSELGRQIANLINIFNPEAVIIGGSMQSAGDMFIEPLKLAVRRYSLRLISQNVAIRPSTLGERAGCTGACLKARDEFFKSII